jgi:hypothetical protein
MNRVTPRLLIPACAAWVVGSALALEPAESERDPTQWPAALRQAQMAATAASAASANEAELPGAPRHVVFANGRAFVVAQGRRLGVGDLLDGARIQRIDDKAVWLLQAGRSRREPLYGGVEKRDPPAAGKPASAASAAAARPRSKNSKETP